MIKKWMKKFSEKLHKANEDDRGSAFVMVVIGVMATAIIGATVLSLATNYFVSVVVDQEGTDNYYETEAIVAEIRSGLEEIAGESNEAAYMQALNEYTSSTGNLQDIYAKLYLSGIIYGIKNYDGFTKDSYAGHVKDYVVNGILDDSKLKIDSGWEPERMISTKDPDIMEFSDSQNWFSPSLLQPMITRPDTVITGKKIDYIFYQDKSDNRYWLTLKDIKVSYKDEQGYQTEIKTDIVINVPDYRFEGDDTFDQLKNYISISDDLLTVEGQATVGFKGNVYAGGTQTDYNYSEGIVTGAKSTVSFDSDKIITRGALNLLTGSSVTINGADFWTKNILLNTYPSITSSSTLNLNCNSYVLDDLSINDDNSNVILGGTYYGYSYNIDNVKDSSRQQLADYSSAILVNGKNTLLDAASNLSKLVLAGRAFVERNNASGIKEATNVEDIAMGESASIKSNQVAYLLPQEYIVKGHNPLLTATEFDSSNVEANYNKDILLQDLEQYLNKDEPVTLNYNNAGGYVYLYLNFKDYDSANKYFSDYYSNTNMDNVDMINERAQTYITSNLAVTPMDGIKISPTLYLLAGNVIKSYFEGANGDNKMKANYFANTDASESLLDDGKKKMIQYMSLQLALVGGKYPSSSGVPRMENYYESATSSQKKEIDLVKGKIVDFDKVDKVSDGRVEQSFKEGKAYITSDGISSLQSLGITKGLVIAKEDVIVDCNFEGLIISGGKVVVKTGGTYKESSNASMLVEILDWIKGDDTWKKFFYATQEGSKTKKTVAECINYENWTKN